MFIPKIIKETARKLRKNMTPAEKILWDNIRKGKILNKQFQKQKPIFIFEENSGLPRYIIADFVCIKNKLIIELDGSIHDLKEVLLLDKEKQQLLENRGYQVIRFTNDEVFNDLEGVLKSLSSVLSLNSKGKEEN